MVSKEIIEKGAEIIRNGGLVAFPTETVYGLGANALDPIAVAKIFAVKERPVFDPLIVHIADISDLTKLADIPTRLVMEVARRFWPGPLTMVLPKKDIVPDIVTSGLDTVAIRMPSHEVARALIKASGCPVAAPSANKFGRLSPTTAKHVEKQLAGVDLILDGGETTVGIESTVITFHNDGFEILRPGVVTKEEIELVIPASKISSTKKGLSSPGLLDSHYSPSKPLYILNESVIPASGKIAYIAFMSIPAAGTWEATDVLSEKGDLAQAAVNLFGILHAMEESDADFIIAEPVPERGIGIAIMDRLRKAAFRYTCR